MKNAILAALLAAPLSAQADCFTTKASYYANKFNGRTTANGETFSNNKLTAAHKTLPFGTVLDVTRGGRTVRVRINDRGPFIKGRGLDLSKSAMRKINGVHRGVVRVTACIVK